MIHHCLNQMMKRKRKRERSSQTLSHLPERG
jgi:hypothetical protein